MSAPDFVITFHCDFPDVSDTDMQLLDEIADELPDYDPENRKQRLTDLSNRIGGMLLRSMDDMVKRTKGAT